MQETSQGTVCFYVNRWKAFGSAFALAFLLFTAYMTFKDTTPADLMKILAVVVLVVCLYLLSDIFKYFFLSEPYIEISKYGIQIYKKELLLWSKVTAIEEYDGKNESYLIFYTAENKEKSKFVQSLSPMTKSPFYINMALLSRDDKFAMLKKVRMTFKGKYIWK